MASLEALQDRFQRNVVFSMRVSTADKADPLARLLTEIQQV